MQAEDKNGQETGACDAFSPERRFDRMTRLVGEAKMERLAGAHVAVVGVGGVGSWAAESLARSGVGRITLMDFDDVCITNFNRQLHAVEGLIGKQKAEVMADRLRSIAPKADIRVLPFFYAEETAARFFETKPDFVIDAIDCVTSKCHLVSACRSAGVKMVTSTGSGGRLDPTRIEVADLSETDVDPLARVLRKFLRRDYAFPGEDQGLFGIPAVFSRELPASPISPTYDGGKGFKCMCGKNNNPFFNCDQRNLIMGNASFVTGAFGLHCAAVAVRTLMQD
jgi:tRNA A37 threonylcarbamoyladenosine dehydratase